MVSGVSMTNNHVITLVPISKSVSVVPTSSPTHAQPITCLVRQTHMLFLKVLMMEQVEPWINVAVNVMMDMSSMLLRLTHLKDLIQITLFNFYNKIIYLFLYFLKLRF